MYDDDHGKAVYFRDDPCAAPTRSPAFMRSIPANQEKRMSEKFETQKVSFEDALQMQIYTSQALMDVLVDKGIVTYQEVLARVEALKKEHHFEISGITEH